MKKLLFFFFSLFIFTNVHAVSYDVTANSYVNNYQFPNWWDVTATGSNANRQLTLKYNDWQLLSQQSETGYASYGYLYICASNPFTVITPPVCSNGCFGPSLNLVSLGGNCVTGEGNNTRTGSYYFLFYTIESWAWNQEHTLPYFSDVLQFSTTYTSSRITFYSNTLTDSDYYVQYASTNQLQALQEETNSKLQDLIDSNSDLKDSIDDVKDSINDLGNTTSDINDSISDQSVSDPGNAINLFKGRLATNNTIANLVTLPITIFQKMLTALNSNCSSFDLGSLYGTNIVLPCIDISDYIGVALFNTIDVLISGIAIYHISKKFIRIFEQFSSLKEGDIIND